MKKKYLYIMAASLLVAGVEAKDSIYKEGWIDFNKNGKMDTYENPEAPIEARIQDLLDQMTVEEKTCQLATLYGSGRILQDSLPTARWKEEVWKDGIANIDEQLNGIGSGRKRYPELIYPFSNHAKAINQIQQWFIEETRLGIPVDFTPPADFILPLRKLVKEGKLSQRVLDQRVAEVLPEKRRKHWAIRTCIRLSWMWRATHVGGVSSNVMAKNPI